MTIQSTNADLKKDLHKGLADLRTLRDEVRVKLHLAGMEAKKEWDELEPQLAELERAAGDLGAAAQTAVSKAVSRLSKLRDSLQQTRTSSGT
jgi:hypothetical protein